MTTAPLYHPCPERWPQVSLKGFFVLVTIFGVWLGVQVKWIRDRHDALKEVEWVADDADSPAPPAPSSLWIFGEQGVERITVPDSEVDRFRVLFPEAQIDTWGPCSSTIPVVG